MHEGGRELVSLALVAFGDAPEALLTGRPGNHDPLSRHRMRSHPRIADIRAMSDDLAAAAKRVHAEWDQDASGFDEVLGTGGICQDVASAMVDRLSAAGFEHAVTVHGTIGENHVWVVALCSDGVYAIDIGYLAWSVGSHLDPIRSVSRLRGQ